MAMLFDLDPAQPADSADPVDAAFKLISDHIGGLDPRSALSRIRRYQHRLGALETGVVAKLNQDTGNDRASKRLLNDGKTSRKAIAKAARRGDVAARNAGLIDKMASGDLSEEQLDVIADTSAKTSGAAATDAAFIDEIAGVDPDQAETVAAKFVSKHADPDGVETEHMRQRRLRRASRYHAKKSGLDTIALQGDAVAIKNMWAQIKDRANELYQADGGRDLNGDHPRTHEQRLFDATHEILCGVTTTPTGFSPTPRHSSDGKSSKPQVLVGLTLEKYLGMDDGQLAEQIGLGQIPDCVLADYLEHADIIGMLYDKNGHPLWIGRTKRHATLMQRYALIARDKACVHCGADHGECEVHHLVPWNAPAKGETNLDELVLLCGRCHRQLHADSRTLYRDDRGTWRTRPAQPHETPPGHHSSRNQPRRE